jgi:tRNA(Ile)-lysidine synthase
MVTKGQGYQEQLEPRVLCFIQEHNLVSVKYPLLVAVSGGPDSVCLLHILLKLRKNLNIKLHIAHLNHQLRGAESEADARYVAQLASRLGVPAIIEERDVRAYQAQKRNSLEEAAREVRYTFLSEVAESIGADRVAVGHTSDDHIETILMHLVRGTGTQGLRGLQPANRWRSGDKSLMVIRPLLGVSRQETVDYCRNYQLEPRIDSSNLSLSTLRNKIRHQLLPLLQSYNPQVADALIRTGRIAEDNLAFLNKESARLWGSIVQRRKEMVILDKAGFLGLPPALQRHLLRQAIEELLGNLRDIETRHIEEMLAILDKPAGKSLNLPGNLVFIIEYDRYLITLKSTDLSPFPVINGEFVMKIPGETLFPGWTVKATFIKQEQMGEKKSEFVAYLNSDRIGDRLVIRCRQHGDRFQPLGMSQTKKLGEYMIDAKIPRAWRQRVPIVCSPEHIVWVVGWRIDGRVKVTENNKQVLRLEFQRVYDNSTGVETFK